MLLAALGSLAEHLGPEDAYPRWRFQRYRPLASPTGGSAGQQRFDSGAALHGDAQYPGPAQYGQARYADH